MKKVYKVVGRQYVEVTKWVKANSAEEAFDIVNDMGIELTDYCNDTIGIGYHEDATELSEAGYEIEWDSNSVEEDESHEYDTDTDTYRFEIWYDGNCIHDFGDDEYEYESDAENEADDWVFDYMHENEMSDDEYSDFEILIEEA